MAEEIITQEGAQEGANNNNDELFKKLDSIIEKRIDGLTKSILKDNGVEDDELKEMLTKYKAGKSQKANADKTNLINLQNENAALKKQIIDGKINATVASKAAGLGVDAAQLPYVLKLADLTNVVGEDGAVDETKIEDALNKVLEDVPVLKTSKKEDKKDEDNKGFKNIGPDNKGDDNEDPLDRMRKIMGLKK